MGNFLRLPRQLAWTWSVFLLLGIGQPVSADPAKDPGQTAVDWIQRFDRNQDQRLDQRELTAALAALEPDRDLEFVRVQRDTKGVAQSLETSIVSYRNENGRLQVDLIGAVHVADRNYYDKLNQAFRKYDVVLYELIAPEGTRIPRGGGQANRHPASRLQNAIKSVLDLSFQLDQIDYTAKHLVHADMSPQEFAATMKSRGESFWQILFRMMTQAANQDQAHAASDVDLLFALFAPDRPLRLKRIMAGQFENLDEQISVFEGPNGSTIISERNKRALEVLRREIEKGHDKIGIFYGAGHMPDMSARLQTDFELTPHDTHWLKAWDLSAAGDK